MGVDDAPVAKALVEVMMYWWTRRSLSAIGLCLQALQSTIDQQGLPRHHVTRVLQAHHYHSTFGLATALEASIRCMHVEGYLWLLNMGVRPDGDAMAILCAVNIGGQALRAVLAAGARLPAPDIVITQAGGPLCVFFDGKFVFGRWYITCRKVAKAQWKRWHAPGKVFKRQWVACCRGIM